MSLQVTVSGGSLCWRLPLCRLELNHALEAMLAVVLSETMDETAAPPAQEALELDLLLVRDAEMAKLNRQHMGCPGPTNILSFPLETFAAGEQTPEARSLQEQAAAEPDALGSLVLSVDALHRETLLYGQDLQEHCLRLLAHGMGHLAGYDHSPEMDALCAAMLDAGRLALIKNSFMV